MITKINKKFLIGLLFICHLSFSAAQSLEQMGGVYYAYPVTKTELVEVPEGYEPFYISHYGRHGSRWLPNDDRYIWVNQQFEDKGRLTKLGKSVRKRLQKVWKDAKGNGGLLTRPKES